MLALDAALVSAHQPPFQQRSDDMGSRHHLMRRRGASVDKGDQMLVADMFQPGIGAPSIGVNFSSWPHGVLYERKQAGGGNVLDAPEMDAADAATVTCVRGIHGSSGDITEVVLTRLDEPGENLVIESWHPGRGLETTLRR